MPLHLRVGDAWRLFDFYAPRAWQQYVEAEGPLPLVIALHPAAVPPTLFRALWSFHDRALAGGGALEDRFFVVYPYAAGVGSATAPEPDAAWAYGYDSRGYTDASDDVAFFEAILAALEARLDDALAEASVAGPAIDPDRVYLFGQLEGGQMVHRLVAGLPDRFAAIYTISASHGGLPHGGAGVPPLYTNQPAVGSRPVHAFVHIGGLDRYVSSVLPGPNPSARDVDRLFDELQDAALAQMWGRWDLPPQATVEIYRTHGGCTITLGPQVGLPSVGVANVSTMWTWLGVGLPPGAVPGGPAAPIGPAGAGPPVPARVVSYEDPLMDEVNVVGPTRYATAAGVWGRWFRDLRRPT